jgi:DNA-binding CsgD family transcriptional regulator
MPLSVPDDIDSLTPRERQVFELVARGLSNADIGGVLNISPSTAKNHVASVLRKLDVHNRTEAVGLFGPSSQPAITTEAASPPAIAVLRMRCLDLDPLTRQLADGIVDDLITSLSRRWYPVIARCSTFSVVDWRQARRALPRRGLAQPAGFAAAL